MPITHYQTGNMEKELMTLVQSKSYDQLTAVELEQLSDWCSNEEEFEQLKYLYKGLEKSNLQQENETVSASVKESLDQIFQEQFSVGKHSNKQRYYILKRPYLQLAAMVVLIVLCYPLFNTRNNSEATSHKKVAVVINKTHKKIVNEHKHEQNSATKSNSILDVLPELVNERNKQATQIARVESQFLDSSNKARLDFFNDFKTPSFNEISSSESIVSAVEIAPVEKSTSTVSIDLLDLLTPCF
jgi:hypothetical protein